MPLSNNPSIYGDVDRALRLALLNPDGCVQPMIGATAEERRKRSVRWRQRAYHYRELLRKQSEAYRGTSKEDLAGQSEFDPLVIRIREDGNIVIAREDNIVPAPQPLNGITMMETPVPTNDVVDLGLDIGEAAPPADRLAEAVRMYEIAKAKGEI